MYGFDCYIHAIDIAYRLAVDGFNSSKRINMAVFDEQKAVAVANSEVEIVNNDYDTDFVLHRYFADDAHNLVLIFQVKIARRLVKHQNFRLLGKRTGEHHFLKFAAAKLINISERIEYTLRISSAHELTDRDKEKIKEYLENAAVDGIVHETSNTSLAAMYWHVK